MIDEKIFDLMERGERLEAYQLLVENYHSALTRSAEYWIGRYKIPATPDETVEDVLVRFVMDELHRRARNFLPYLKSMVRADLHKLGRYYWRVAELPSDVKGYSALEEEVTSRDEAERLEREIVTSFVLSTNQLRSLVLRHQYDFTEDIIAQTLELKPSSVPVMISNAKKRLREYYGAADYTPHPLDENDELVFKIYKNHMTCVMVYAEHLGKQKAGSP